MHNIATAIRWNACSFSYSLLSPWEHTTESNVLFKVLWIHNALWMHLYCIVCVCLCVRVYCMYVYIYTYIQYINSTSSISLLHQNSQRICAFFLFNLVSYKVVWASKDECVCVMEWKGLWEDTPPVGILISTGLCLWTPHIVLLTDFRSPARANKEPYTNSRHTVTLLPPPQLPPHQDPHRWELKSPPPRTDISFSRN